MKSIAKMYSRVEDQGIAKGKLFSSIQVPAKPRADSCRVARAVGCFASLVRGGLLLLSRGKSRGVFGGEAFSTVELKIDNSGYDIIDVHDYSQIREKK